jgi:hypothetical protein
MLSEKELQVLRSQMKASTGRFKTLSLFWETRREGNVPLFTLKSYDHTVDGVTYPSLKKLYFEFDHVPGYEYEFATTVLGGWDQWMYLTQDSTIKDTFRGWREEYEIMLKANAIKQLIMSSKVDDAKGNVAARYLADKAYEVKRGRPSKAEVEREKKIAAGVNETLAADMERLGLTVVEGGK